MIQIMPSPDLTFADAVDMAFRFGCLTRDGCNTTSATPASPTP